jgi:cullin-associated NEDD8-dissociated protein 1
LNHASHGDQAIRNLVQENIGRLYVTYSEQMYEHIEKGMQADNAFVRQTVAGSFKYGASKQTDSLMLEMALNDLCRLVSDPDIQVQTLSLRALASITSHHPAVTRRKFQEGPGLLNEVIRHTVVRPDLVSEVDLGPFKHKVDNGIPIRDAALAFLDHAIEKNPTIMSHPGLVECIIAALDDPSEECMVSGMQMISKITQHSASAVFAHIDHILDSFEKQFTKHLKNISSQKSSEKSQNIVRSTMRALAGLARNPDVEQSNRFTDFIRVQVLENPTAKEMYTNQVQSMAKSAEVQH